MTTLRRLLVVLVVIGLVAGAVYAVEQALRPQLLVLLDNGERRGEAAEARGEHEDDDEHREEEHAGPRRGRGAGKGRERQRAEGPSPLDEHFEPLEGLAGLGGDVLLVGAVGGAVIGVDYAAVCLRKPRRK